MRTQLLILFTIWLLGRSENLYSQRHNFINSIGMEMVAIPTGSFFMGNEGEVDYSKVALDAKHASYAKKGSPHPHLAQGATLDNNPLEWDESPVHKVNITKPLYVASKPITNKQYEMFDPSHRYLRGKRGFSMNDEDAVVYVSWNEAQAFADWLSKKEGKPYRLPTEAEWEYFARAGTSTPYNTGENLPEAYFHHQVMNRTHSIKPELVNLRVAQNPPNSWGLYDIHGLVEEWCWDWYGPYSDQEQTDPIGPNQGISKVTRGGSHSTGLPFLRSANRSGALPDTRSFLIGFRLILGEMPDTESREVESTFRWANDVSQTILKTPHQSQEPIFNEPKTFTILPEGGNGPLYITHNHNPAIAALPNGDLLAIWFTTVKERGREMLVAGARYRYGAKQWDDADIFFHVPDRNQTGQALWWDKNHTLYHVSGVGIGDHWRDLSVIVRKSHDNGVTWTEPEWIDPDFGPMRQPLDASIITNGNTMIFVSDAGPEGQGGSVIYKKEAHSLKWENTSFSAQKPIFLDGVQGNWVAGIHAAIVELKDGRLMALGRGDEIHGRMPKSISNDGGRTWTYTSSGLDPIGGAQRAALTRLQEGPILLASFSDSIPLIDNKGQAFVGKGMYVALSYDEGETWPIKKLVSNKLKPMILSAPCNWRWGAEYSTLSKHSAESRGYLTMVQAQDGMIHLLSSGTHYSFNLNWIIE